jgi:translation elongation factor aEF-1 beta
VSFQDPKFNIGGGLIIGDFIAMIDIVPEDTDINFEVLVGKLKNVLPETCLIEHYDILPVAFGLKKARLRVRYPEEWGGTDKLEELFQQVEGIQGIEGIAFSKA